MLVIVAPGQGSQAPGFLAPWLELPGLPERLERLSEVAQSDLVAHGTTSDAPTIKDTAVAQPLIVGAGLVALSALFGVDRAAAPDRGDDAGRADGRAASPVGATAGHSVGEITAAAFAGVLTEDEAVAFVRERGRGMAQASAVAPTGMSAVVGGDPEEVLAVLDSLGLTPANLNGAGQVVAAGTLEQLSALDGAPPARARVVPLQVAGAFHTRHMDPAVDRLARHVLDLAAQDPAVPLVSNADGTVVDDGEEVLRRLVRQVSNPVRWDLTMDTFLAMGVTGLIEIPPAGTLVGLAKRALRGVETLALKTPDDLDQARRMIQEHGGPQDAGPDAPPHPGQPEHQHPQEDTP
ncbi:ACP S-malonyltransferase [Ornithinimicrobium sp. W1665]|uniref:ACP S-malonyltransferase n=1 Tax=Ornithinimicrobium sp. W1665 TaxID=3416666 RepID=UPI003CF86266